MRSCQNVDNDEPWLVDFFNSSAFYPGGFEKKNPLLRGIADRHRWKACTCDCSPTEARLCHKPQTRVFSLGPDSWAALTFAFFLPTTTRKKMEVFWPIGFPLSTHMRVQCSRKKTWVNLSKHYIRSCQTSQQWRTWVFLFWFFEVTSG